MAYTILTQYNSPNYTPAAQVPYFFGMQRIIIGNTAHWWGDPNANPSFEGVINWLCRANGNSSAHAVATGTGRRVAWLINAWDAAWHSGNAKGNAQTIGLELDPRCRAEDYDVAAELIADIWISYNKKLDLYRHNQWSSTQCPGNYDTNRLQREAEAWYARKTAPANPSKPVPAATRLSTVKRFKAKLQPTSVWDLNSNPNYKAVTTLNKDAVFEAFAYIDFNNTRYYVTKYSFEKGLKNAVNQHDLVEIVPEPVKPEWARNLKDVEPKKLAVLPAAGARVWDLNTMEPKGDVIPRGTMIDVAKETTVGGKRYLVSQYSATKAQPNGILATELGTPVEPPVNEKPDWLKNLKDIADVDMWARSEAPVLRLEDAKEVKRLAINTQVRVTHATRIADTDLLVLEGGATAIETVYLSDKPISAPNDDLEKRVGALEKLVDTIIKFLQSIFKGFNKGE